MHANYKLLTRPKDVKYNRMLEYTRIYFTITTETEKTIIRFVFKINIHITQIERTSNSESLKFCLP